MRKSVYVRGSFDDVRFTVFCDHVIVIRSEYGDRGNSQCGMFHWMDDFDGTLDSGL